MRTFLLVLSWAITANASPLSWDNTIVDPSTAQTISLDVVASQLKQQVEKSISPFRSRR